MVLYRADRKKQGVDNRKNIFCLGEWKQTENIYHETQRQKYAKIRFFHNLKRYKQNLTFRAKII